MPRRYGLTVAPNGARRSKADHPALPITLREIADCAASCYQAGADQIHLHVRDANGAHSLDTARYQDAMAAIAQTAPGMKIQITTESAGIFAVADQLACLEQVRPDAASISVREMSRDPKLAAKAYAVCDETGAAVQHILYTPGCIRQLRQWFANGVVPRGQNGAIFVLGAYAPAVMARPQDLTALLWQAEDLDLAWSACAFGPAEHACLAKAVQLGGDVRVGFENNLCDENQNLFADNADSVRVFVHRLRQIGYELKHRPARATQLVAAQA